MCVYSGCKNISPSMIGPRAAVFSFFIPGRRAVIIKIPPPPPLAREQSSCIFLTGINYWIHRDVYFTTRADKFQFERCHKVKKKCNLKVSFKSPCLHFSLNSPNLGEIPRGLDCSPAGRIPFTMRSINLRRGISRSCIPIAPDWNQ